MICTYGWVWMCVCIERLVPHVWIVVGALVTKRAKHHIMVTHLCDSFKRKQHSWTLTVITSDKERQRRKEEKVAHLWKAAVGLTSWLHKELWASTSSQCLLNLFPQWFEICCCSTFFFSEVWNWRDLLNLCPSFMWLCLILVILYVHPNTCDPFFLMLLTTVSLMSSVKCHLFTVPLKTSLLFSAFRNSCKTHMLFRGRKKECGVNNAVGFIKGPLVRVTKLNNLIVHFYSCHLAGKPNAFVSLFFNRDHTLSAQPLIYDLHLHYLHLNSKVWSAELRSNLPWLSMRV